MPVGRHEYDLPLVGSVVPSKIFHVGRYLGQHGPETVILRQGALCLLELDTASQRDAMRPARGASPVLFGLDDDNGAGHGSARHHQRGGWIGFRRFINAPQLGFLAANLIQEGDHLPLKFGDDGIVAHDALAEELH